MKVLFPRACIGLFILCLFTAGITRAAIPPSNLDHMPLSGLYVNSSTSSPLLNLINSARKMIDIEIYTMGDVHVQQAILNALHSGVRVRIIQEPTPFQDPCRIFSDAQSEDGSNAACNVLKAFRANVLQAGGTYVPFNHALCGNATPTCLEHGKIVIADAKVALLSTGNFDSTNLCDKSQNPSRCNRDYSYVVSYSPDVQLLGQIFEHDLAAVPYDLAGLMENSGTNDLMVSPLSLTPLVQFIRSAKTSIAIQEQYLKDPDMNNELLAAQNRGVQLFINVSSVCAFGTPTKGEGDKWAATYQAFEDAGAKIRILTKDVKIDGVGGYLHAKNIVVDGTQAWMGSVNGSTESIGSNREFGIFFSSPRDVDTMLKVMRSDFNNPGGETWQESLNCVRN